MYIYFEQLAQALQAHVGVRTYNIFPHQIISGIQMFPSDFWAQPNALKSDVAYLCEYRKLKQFDPHKTMPPLICALEPGLEPDELFFQSRSVLTVTGCHLADIFQTLIRAAYDCGRSSSPLTEITRSFLHCQSLSELIDRGFQVLGNPLLVTNNGQQIIAYTDEWQVFDPTYRDIIKFGYVPAGHSNREFAAEGNLPPSLSSKYKFTDVPFLQKGNKDGLPSVIIKTLVVGRQVVGYLHILSFNRDFGPDDIHIADLLGGLIAVELARQPDVNFHNIQEQRELFLRNILDNRLSSDEEILEYQTQANIKMSPYLQVLLIYPRKLGDAPTESVYIQARQAAALIPNSIGFLYRNSIVILLNSDKEMTDFESNFQPFLPMLKKNNQIMGVSNVFTSICRLREHSYQANRAVQMGLSLHHEQLIYDYHSYMPYFLMASGLKNDPLEAFCSPKLLQFADYCRANHSELLDTLRVYLQCAQNKSKASRKLHIHLNTMKYRLTQIEDFLGTDIDNDENALNLMISLEILDHIEKLRTFNAMQP